jgi:long-chain acyl-CoA synthetase
LNLTDRSSAPSLDHPRLVHELLEHAAATWPEKQALVVAEGAAGDGSRWSYRDLNQRSNQLARGLQLRGASPGDRIALLAPNGVFYVTAYFAIVKAGCIAVPLSTAIDVSTLLHQLAICRPRLLLVGARAERVVVDAGSRLAELPDLTAVLLASRMAAPALTRSGLPIDILDPWEAPSAPPCDNLDLAIASSGLATIIFTSGSTGKPRGAALTHAGLCSNVAGIVASLTLQHDDRVLVVLPLSYVFGKSLLTMCVAVGATAVIENRFQYPKTALDTVEVEGCTGIAGVPSTFAILAHRTDLRSRELPTLRWLAQAGGGMSPTLIRELVEMLPRARIYIMYGATEGSGRLSCLPAEELASAIGSIGRAIAGVTLTVYRDDGQECDVGESGELFATGDNIMAGYYGDVDATGEVLSDRGYATGDLAYRDARGLLWLVGRKRDIFKVGGYRVGAREIEDAISEHPAISEAAVIGVPDEVLGDRLVAYVVLRGADGQPIDARTLQNFLRHRLAAHKIPAAIVGCAELPKNLAGKVMKDELLRQWNAAARQQETLQPIGGDQDP